jgi:hypothetical protein
MDKIRNGDSVIYKEQQGTIYGKPRESKHRGTLYTVKVGDDYFKASPGELTLSNQDGYTRPMGAWGQA